MSNQACLFAEDTSAPYNPLKEDEDESGASTVQIAGAAYGIPVFWMFCFAEEDLRDVQLSQTKLSTLVAPMETVRQRLHDRDGLARELFPDHTTIWSMWKRSLCTVDRRYLKIDAYEIWMLYQDGDRLTSDLKEALAWFGEQGSWELTSLFKLAGIEDYDEEERRILFDEEESCPEEFLIGWLEIEDQEC